MKLRWCFFPFVLTALFASCSPAQSESSIQNASSEYETIIKDQTILWKDCLSQEEDDYLVFIYSETCDHCHEIIGDVIAFSQENILKTYFVNKSNTENEILICAIDEITVGVDDIDKLAVAGTPTLLEVESGRTTANAAGANHCLTFLNELRVSKKK